MTRDSIARWLATAALFTSAAALTVALGSGCREYDAAHAELETPNPAAQRAPVQAPNAAAASPEQAPALAAEQTGSRAKAGGGDEANAEEPAGKPKPDPAAATAATLKVQRLVITRGVEAREPLPSEPLVLGAPVFAFLELENEGDAQRSVVLTFERDTASVGHVQLAVPPSSPRWRTWGKTALIREAGTWTAVVRTVEGDELARQAFEVVRG